MKITFTQNGLRSRHRGHESQKTQLRRESALDCGSPLPLSDRPPSLEKRQRTGAVQNLTAVRAIHGKKAGAIVAIIEDYPTARSAREQVRKRKAVTPVFDEVYAMLCEGKNVHQAVQDLTARESKTED